MLLDSACRPPLDWVACRFRRGLHTHWTRLTDHWVWCRSVHRMVGPRPRHGGGGLAGSWGTEEASQFGIGVLIGPRWTLTCEVAWDPTAWDFSAAAFFSRPVPASDTSRIKADVCLARHVRGPCGERWGSWADDGRMQVWQSNQFKFRSVPAAGPMHAMQSEVI